MDYEHQAIEWLKLGSEMSFAYYGKPLLLCYSGGKDSDVVLELAKRSGIPFEIQHSHTTVDAPQTVHHVRKKFYELELQGFHPILNYPTYQRQRTSMWDSGEKVFLWWMEDKNLDHQISFDKVMI